ncbi:MAG: tetratricopeptide repeat protein [Gemmatimonadales bacterium]|nr:tetratricopeptide repeat protein [Gemmatimonadales bacterium]
MTLDKLKVAARQHEQRDDWRAAIELYRQAIREAEGGSEGADPQLYNRIGDLEQKTGDAQAACEAWEHGAARYGEQGFFNNAIALCGKILRLDPVRHRTLLEMARLQARKRVIHDAGLNLRTYLDQMNAAGHGDDARQALELLGREFSSWAPMQELLDQLLERAPADDSNRDAGPGTTSPPGRESGGARGLVFLDTEPLTLERASDVSDVTPDGVSGAPDVGAGLELETGAVLGLETSFNSGDDLDAQPADVAGLVEIAPSLTADDAVAVDVPGLVDIESTIESVGDTALVEGFDGAVSLEPTDADAGVSIDGLESTSLQTPDDELDADPDVVTGGEIIFIDPSEPSLGDDPLDQRVAGHEMLEHGDRAGAIAALERSLATHTEREEWLQALRVAAELVEAEPASILRHQARVEMAVRLQHPARLCEAYADLGQALLREGSDEKAIAVFRRVLELDEHHAGAREALRAMAPEREVAPGDDGYIDFGAMVNDDVGPRTTRMRTETTAISANEDETFQEALTEFKRALDQNLGVEEHQAHYDLGIAFREMGLMDEAISEFQKALRSPESRMRSSEALGQVFFEQGRPGVAEAVLRGVERGPEGDADKIGVLYWLGRALEAQGRGVEAQGCYERVLAVDVTFHDASDRAHKLQAERSQ